MNATVRNMAMFVTAGVILALAAPLRAADPASQLNRRVVQQFDFEERQRGNFEEMPMHWFRVRAPGYPDYTRIGFDDAVAISGQHSLKLQLNGGSAAVVLQRATIAAVPGADYLVTAQLRTADLDTARARVIAYFVDQQGQIIEQSVTATEPLASDGAWTQVHVELIGRHPEAAWVVIRLQLLQQSHWRLTPLGPHELNVQDLDAAAWFDDVTVYQLPRIRLETASPTNIIRAPERPALSVEVVDLTGASLRANIVVYDHRGRPVDQFERLLEQSHPGRWRWEPNLPGFGWYYADLQVIGEQGTVGRSIISLAYLPASRGRGIPETQRFIIDAADLPPAQRPLIEPLLRAIDAEAVILPAWWASMSARELEAPRTAPDPVIQSLLRDGRHVTLCLAAAPSAISAPTPFDPQRPIDLLLANPPAADAALDALLVRYGQAVTRWQIGLTSSNYPATRSDLPTAYPALEQRFARYVSGPRLILPWPANMPLDSLGSVRPPLHFYVPPAVSPHHIPDYAAAWNLDADDADVTLHLDSLRVGRYAHADRIADFARRLIHAWKVQPGHISVPRLWGQADRRQAAILPDALLPVYVNLRDQLAGRRFVGQLPQSAGIEAHILDGREEGVVVAWNNHAPDAHLILDVHLARQGAMPAAVDVFGNRTPIPLIDGKYRYPLTQTPVFVEGLDMKLARFPASFRIEPDFAEAAYRPHPHELVIRNPWPLAISGRLRITAPSNWQFQPSVADFNIPADGELRIPLEITFPINESAGPKQVAAHFQIEADRRYELNAAATLLIGLKTLRFDPSLTFEPNPQTGEPTLILIHRIMNVGDKPLSFFTFAAIPGQARREAVVSNLLPGESVIKRFAFPDPQHALAGRQALVGLRMLDDPAVLNQVIEIP